MTTAATAIPPAAPEAAPEAGPAIMEPTITAAALSDAEREVGGQLYLALGRLLRWSARQGPDQFGPGVLSALGTLVDNGRLRLGDLAAREGIAPASLTRIVAILEAEALVTRSTDPSDRRSAFVQATPTGAALVLDRRRARGEQLARRLAPLGEDRLAALRDIVRAIDDLAAAT